jgi:hypothetical protein
MAIVIPEYLSKRSLPLASDIFFHQNIIYFLPTGFHPTEINSVLDFPDYCKKNEVALPYTIWDSCRLYFEADKEALECVKILEPFRRNFIKFVLPIYPRGRKEIDDCKVTLKENPDIYKDFKETALDLTFVSRELLSHILYEIFLEEGYEGAVKYIKENFTSIDDLLLLIAAVLINRLRIFSKMDSSFLMYNHSWYPVFDKLLDLLCKTQKTSSSDSLLVEHFQYKLFEMILYPVYGYCNLHSKNHEIAKIAKEKVAEINCLKEECMSIAEEVVLLPTTDTNLKQKRLSNLLNKRVVGPLGDIANKPVKDINQIIKDFVLDSTVVGGLVAMIENPDPIVLKVALAAGAISASARYLFRDKSLEKNIPSQIILEGMKKMRVDYEQIQNDIKGILIEDTSFPEKWK